MLLTSFRKVLPQPASRLEALDDLFQLEIIPLSSLREDEVSLTWLGC
jgi:hypothetical protein